jgi:hypothetical protein
LSGILDSTEASYDRPTNVAEEQELLDVVLHLLEEERKYTGG